MLKCEVIKFSFTHVGHDILLNYTKKYLESVEVDILGIFKGRNFLAQNSLLLASREHRKSDEKGKCVQNSVCHTVGRGELLPLIETWAKIILFS